MNEILRELDLESREFSGVFESLIGSAKKQGSLIDRFLLHYETFNPFYKNILLKSTQPVNNKEEATPQNTIPIEETPSPEKQSNTKGLQKGKKKKGGKSVEPKQEIIEQPAKASPAKKQEMEIVIVPLHAHIFISSYSDSGDDERGTESYQRRKKQQEKF